MMKNHKKSLLALVLLGLFGLSACTFDGDDGKDGADGAPGTPGADGQNGQDGQDAGSAVSAVYNAGDVAFTIEPADNTLAGTGTFALKFKVTAKDQAGAEKPLSGINQVAIYSTTAMPNDTGDGPATVWVNNGADGAHSMYCTLDGTYSSRGETGDACILAEDPANPGTYTGTWQHDGVAPIMNANDDLNAPHRVFLRVYNLKDATDVTKSLSGKVLSQPLDYVPATGALVESTGKDTVADAACIQCHGENAKGTIANIEAHGNYESVKNCIACHNPATQPDADQAAKGYVFDLPAMIHRIHGGKHVADYSGGVPGAWANIEFPAPVYECTTCHNATDEEKTTWNTAPTRAACQGCHTGVNFETGVGHEGIPQANDENCSGCHRGSLAPINAHKVGKRAEYSKLADISFTGAKIVGPSTTTGYTTVEVTADVTIAGTPITATTAFANFSKISTLMGNVDSTTGEVTRWSGRPNLDGSGSNPASTDAAVANLNASAAVTDGVLTLTFDVIDANATGSIYVGTEANYCVSKDGAIAACDSATTYNPDLAFHYGDPVGASSTVKFFNLTDPTAAAKEARFVDPARITVAEAKCNACHNSLDYIKGNRHGVYTFDQCMDCHNNTWSGSYHPETQILTMAREANGSVKVDATDAPIVLSTAPAPVIFHNRDLVTVAHRFHSGNMHNPETGAELESAGIFLDEKGVLHGYPAPSNDCSVCHKDGTKFFDGNGMLTSGKRAIAVSNYGPVSQVSPIAESCRSCHTSASAEAHFVSNGATVESDGLTDPNTVPVESCATCHAQGKSYGIEKFHIIK
ncbi:OmcA/MtrC family decaheme c-type cytochrome [Shewanella dokdonensis]|uniref:OmcA/MtrC family decaheme c-type cytochrome n=1 Tax=Shewanella dokdonensis TaxID=712036 RepID=A0ABX8DFU1_9GAMM|nr:OmcA/MtrC family decaheme c-type cytochrome [Shewanella dokdonensis]MCL1073807.1 OmcA/MtrC family decaheme c-type cytochrome [Shewanella dokdonensis]QVK23598.1 OmcA/MtrC family decaheme c-type cytochrome [Shewanella dokdonensis]